MRPMKRTLLATGLLILLGPQSGFAQQSEASNNDGADGPIRLEATIRANKEQPRVLTIVPWQLPKYRQIEGALNWQPVMLEPQLIQRESFIRQLAIEQVLEADEGEQATK